MARAAAGMRRGVGRVQIPVDIGALCLVVVLADIIFGIVAPTFSLHAKGLGVGLGALGGLNALGGGGGARGCECSVWRSPAFCGGAAGGAFGSGGTTGADRRGDGALRAGV